MKRRVQFRWKGRILSAIGEGRAEDIIVKSIERRLKAGASGVQLLHGENRGEYLAKYFDGTVYQEDDVTLL